MIIEHKQAQKEIELTKLSENPNCSFEVVEASVNEGKNFYTSQARTREVECQLNQTFEPSHVTRLHQDLKECTFQPKVNNYHPTGPCRFNHQCPHAPKSGSVTAAYHTSNPGSQGFGPTHRQAGREGLLDIPLGYTSNISDAVSSGLAVKTVQSNTPATNQPYVDIMLGDDPAYRTAAPTD